MRNVVLSEQELTVKVGQLNVVVIGAVNFALLSTTETHHREGFHVLTTERTSTNHEGLSVSDLLLNFTTENLDLIVVAAVHRLTVYLLFEVNAIENVVVEPLLEGRVLASVLDDLLGNKTTEEGSLGHNRAGGESCDLLNQVEVKLLNLVLTLLGGIVDGLSDFSDLFGVLHLWVVAVAGVELVTSSDGTVQVV